MFDGRKRRIAAVFMAAVMAISLFAGINLMWTKEATEEVVAKNANPLALSLDTSYEKGDAKNPFVVLEVVPDLAKSQFGYLVDGQEPINLAAASMDTNAAGYSSMLSRYLNMKVTNKDVKVSEFLNMLETTGGMNYELNGETLHTNYGEDGFLWMTDYTSEQFGEYQKDPDGSYALVQTKLNSFLGYVPYHVEDPEEEIPNSFSSDEVSASQIKPYEDVKTTLLAGATNPLELRSDGHSNYYIDVTAGTGTYTDAVYTKVGANKGSYSLEYMYVGTGGDTDIKVTLPEVNVYSSTNTTMTTSSNVHSGHGSPASNGFTNNATNNKGRYVAFVRTEGASGVPTYDIAWASNAVKHRTGSGGWGGGYSYSSSFYYKYYHAIEVTGDDYDVTEDVTTTITDGRFEGNAYDLRNTITTYKTNRDTTFPTTVSANGKTYSRQSALAGGATNQSSKPTGYDAATEFYSNSGKTIVCKRDNDYFYFLSQSKYSKFKYVTTSETVTKKYIFQYETGGASHVNDSDYYIVVFTRNNSGNGKYIADESITDSITEANYHMTYTTTTENTGGVASWEWINKTNGRYKNISKQKPSGKTIAEEDYGNIPQPVFSTEDEEQNGVTLTGYPTKVFLGNYKKTLTSATDNILESFEGHHTGGNSMTAIYAHEYERYLILPVYEVTEKYKYTVEPKQSVSVLEDSVEIIGSYKWSGYTLADSLDIEARGIASTYNATTFLTKEGNPKQFEDGKIPEIILDTAGQQPYCLGYLGGYRNYDLFKKFAVGLGYKSANGFADEDTDSYEFKGWYTDPYGMNPYTGKVTDNIQLYAKWLPKYPSDITSGWDGYTIVFDPNCDDETLVDMPGIAIPTGEDTYQYQLSGFSRDCEIIYPDKIPVRDGYVFEAWYLDEDCNDESLVKEYTHISDIIRHWQRKWGEAGEEYSNTFTFYAKWVEVDELPSGDDLLSIELSDNKVMLPSGTKVTMPEETRIENICSMDGRIYTLETRNVLDEHGEVVIDPKTGEAKTEEVIVSNKVSIPDPVCDKENWHFAGWYLDRACTRPFHFNDANDAMQADWADTIVLYARWLQYDESNPASMPKITITFDGNQPLANTSFFAREDAIVPKTQKIAYKTNITEDLLPEATLRGNIQSKLDDYHIKVITVIPDDLTGDNLNLISKADLIVFNQTCDPDMEALCNKYHVVEDSWYNSRHKASGNAADFGQKDLSWAATLEVLSRITGIKYDASKEENVSVKTCPVLFDYNIYNSTLNSSTYGQITLAVNGKSEGGITLSTNKLGSKSNLYKLYLMTQTANPVTIYNAYFTGRTAKSIELDNSTKTGKMTSGDASKYTFPTGNNADTYWNEYTLVPFHVLDTTAATWNNAANRKQVLAKIGFTDDVSLTSKGSNIRNRMFIYNNSDTTGKTNIVSEFMNNVPLTFQSSTDYKYFMKQAFGMSEQEYTVPDNLKIDEVSANRVFYFMLHGDTLYSNLERDIDILEIQPGSFAHSDEYWFWYISSYAPNITGKITGHPMSSSEFQCNIDDLNAKYDVIFFGTTMGLKNLNGDNIGTTRNNVFTPVDMSPVNPKGPSGDLLAYYHTGTSEYKKNNTTTKIVHSYYAVGSFNTVQSNGTIKNDDLTTNAAYCGNDLTFAGYKKVAAFVKAGYPIVFDEGFYSGNISKPVNANLIDSASWLYKLADEAMNNTNKYSCFREGADDDGRFLAALTKKTFNLIVTKSPVTFKDNTMVSGLQDKDIYINGGYPNDDSKRKLEYTININSIGKSGSYRVKLFIDGNGDGKYDEATEQLDELEVYDTVARHSGFASNMTLQADREYKVSRKLTTDYAGAIPWKLQVVELNDVGRETAVRDEVTGLSAIQPKEREKLYVLQIMSETIPNNTTGSTGEGGNVIFLPTDEEIWSAYNNKGQRMISQYGTAPYHNGTYSQTTSNNYFSGSSYAGSSSYQLTDAAWFHYYTVDLQDFEVHFIRVSASKVNTIATQKKNKQSENYLGYAYKYEPFLIDGEVHYKIVNEREEIYWDDINMLILGFANHYYSALEQNETGRKLIRDFIEEGKAALFTFDTTTDVRWSDKDTYKYLKGNASAVNGSSISYPYIGYNMANEFIDLLGQDKYNVYGSRGIVSDLKYPINIKTENETNISNIGIDNASDYKLLFDLPFKANQSMIIDDTNLMMVEKVLPNGNDGSKYKTKNSGTYRAMVQGLSRNTLRTGSYSVVREATQTNEGQIVAYPYTVGKKAGNDKNIKINISDTHAQWMQLNMEDDDVVVWFTLFSEKKTDNSGNPTSEFDLTQNIINDGTNNYYIYNKSNITFSGVGMSGKAGHTLTDDEYRLFVNTMIASFRSQVKASEPQILNSDKSSDDTRDYIYVDYDAAYKMDGAEGDEARKPVGADVVTKTFVNRNGVTEEYKAKRVYFTIKNDSIVMDKTLSIAYYPVYYYKSGDTAIKVPIYAAPLNLDTYLMEGEVASLSDTKLAVLDEDVKYSLPTDKKTRMTVIDGVTYQDVAAEAEAKYSKRIETQKTYYVDVPITNNYYRDWLARNKKGVTGYLNTGVDLEISGNNYLLKFKNGAANVTATTTEWLGLEEGIDSFEIEMQVVMRYGRDKSKNKPLVGTRGIVLMRRGMFMLQ